MTPEPAGGGPSPDFTIYVLVALVVFFAMATTIVAIKLPTNDKLFNLLAPQLGIFAGALLAWVQK